MKLALSQEIQWRTPDSSDPPSPQLLDKLGHRIQEALETHKEAKDLALVRDGFRCVVTGIYDRTTLSEVSASPDEIREALHTECAHVVPESTYFHVSDQDPSNTKLDYAASVLEVSKCFGYDVEQLNGAKVHSLYNVMTMEANVHESFKRLGIWFEKTGRITLILYLAKVTNCYKLRCIYALHLWPTEVTFTTPDNENLPLVTACARVAHLSGAAQYIDKLDHDVEDLGVLAENGSSGEVLIGALLNRMGSSFDV
ncbi:hypothetical protein EV421DRAFT_1892740 [Armillaria borealis]|uniref:HNH nuclease domain-containing protein n=1 Tax=Armillaria borealis TaxID=47425 RepID=A0AA39J1M0_9AGAR|nr:hypothetical protein EV421DRAFT_1892740 [Armillaria borealis]